jgi:hypothetical protein
MSDGVVAFGRDSRLKSDSCREDDGDSRCGRLARLRRVTINVHALRNLDVRLDFAQLRDG